MGIIKNNEEYEAVKVDYIPTWVSHLAICSDVLSKHQVYMPSIIILILMVFIMNSTTDAPMWLGGILGLFSSLIYIAFQSLELRRFLASSDKLDEYMYALYKHRAIPRWLNKTFCK